MDALLTSLNSLSQEWAQQLWPVLWQSAMLAGAVFLATRVRRFPAALRFWLWMLVPARLLVMPLVTVSLPLLPATGPAEPAPVAAVRMADLRATGGPEIEAARIVAIPANLESIAPAPAAPGPAGAPVLPTIPTLLLIAWVLGVGFFAIRLARGWVAIRRTVARGRPAANPRILDAAARASATLGLARPARVLVTDEPVSPFVYGALRPAVVLPQALTRDVSEDGLAAVLSHEVAHVRRRDPLTGWVVTLCQVLYFFHPAFWLARHHLLLDRETACDECVLAHREARPAAYAEALIRAASAYVVSGRRLAPATVTAESFTHLKRRLLRLAENLQPTARLSRLSISVLLALTVVAMPGITLGIEPPSTKTITVRVLGADKKPVAEAGVEVIAGYRPVASGTTDAEGLARVAIPEDALVQWVVALKSGIGLDFFTYSPPQVPDPVVPVEGFPPPIDVKLVLDGARTVRIRATDSDGKPVAGAAFVPWLLALDDKPIPYYVNLSGSDLGRAVTDSEGVATFDWIPEKAWPAVEKTFLVQGGDYHWPDPPPGDEIGPDTRDLTARLLEKTALGGRVTFPDGRPAAGMLVQVEGRGATAHFFQGFSRTGADGSYRLDVFPDQSYFVAIIDDEWAAHRTGVPVTEGKPVDDVDLSLVAGTLVHGRIVRNVDTGDPVPGELVMLILESPDEIGDSFGGIATYVRERKHLGLVRHTRTDSNGRFAFSVAPGKYWICAMGCEPGSIHAPESIAVPSSSGPEIRFDFTKDAGMTVLGTPGAPVKANHDPRIEYSFQQMLEAEPTSEMCAACHRPYRKE